MSGETTLTIVGNLTEDPELRFVRNGTPVASFTVASTSSIYDREKGGWRDGKTVFMRCSAWKDLAENIAESLRKGMRVMVRGILEQDSWEDERTGERRHAMSMTAQEVGASLRFARVRVERSEKPSQYQAGGQYAKEAQEAFGAAEAARQQAANQVAVEPW